MRHSLLNKTLLALALAGSLAPSVRAQTQTPLGELSGSGQVAYESQYVFRGKKLADSSIQPKAEVGMQIGADGNAYVGGWSNEPVSRRTNVGGPDQSNEIDVFGGFVYNLAFIPVKVDVGDIYYWYPEAGNTPIFGLPGSTRVTRTDEPYIGFTYDTSSTPLLGGANLNPSIYYYHDLMLDSNTLEVSLTVQKDLSSLVGFSGLSVTPTVLGGWYHANRSYGDSFNSGIAGNPHANWRNGYLYWKAGVELDYNISPYCYLFGELDYEGNNDGTAKGFAGTNPQLGGTDSSAWFGIGLKFRR